MRKSVDTVNQLQPRPAEDGVLDLIHKVMHQYRSQQYRVLRDGPHNITHMDSKVLHYFGRHPGATQSDLAQHSGRDKAQLARLIKSLRDQGLLDGEPDAKDRRNVRLSLTSAGLEVQNALRQQAQRLNDNALNGLDAKQRKQLTELLQQVSDNLDAG